MRQEKEVSIFLMVCFFLPWVGCNYENGLIFKKRILVVGDSHYCSSDCKECGVLNPKVKAAEFECRNFTIDIIGCYLDDSVSFQKWMGTFRRFERALSGNLSSTRSDSNEIWQSLAFYNFVQTANIDRPRESYFQEVYEKSLSCFWKVFEELNPEAVIVWGKRVWNQLPPENWDYTKPIGSYSEVGTYKINGKEIPFIISCHPSSSLFSYDKWVRIFKEFFSTDTLDSI